MSVDTSDFAEQRADLLQAIERDQEEVRVAVSALTEAAGAKLDMTEPIKKFPLTWTIGAFVVGAWLGSRAAAAEQRRQG